MTKQMINVCYGISSKCLNHENIIIYDYDNIPMMDVITHCRYLIDELKLSSFYIIKSSNGYNTICLDKIPMGLSYSYGINIKSSIDRDFLFYSLKRGYYVMRIGKDKQHIHTVISNNFCYEKSLAHKLFLEFFFDIEIKDDGFFDNNDKWTFIQFPSYKYGYHLVEVDGYDK